MSAEMPALRCITVPPAKSSAPSELSHPSFAHTQWASGSYTSVVQRMIKNIKPENFILSTNAPKISAGVMTANII